MRDCLRIWNRDVFGNINTRKKRCVEAIQLWDKKEEEEGLTEEERVSRADLKLEHSRILEMEEVM